MFLHTNNLMDSLGEKLLCNQQDGTNINIYTGLSKSSLSLNVNRAEEKAIQRKELNSQVKYYWFKMNCYPFLIL